MAPITWQSDLRRRLEAHIGRSFHLGALFELYKDRIPLHAAGRHYMSRSFSSRYQPTPLPPDSMRWRLFIHTVSRWPVQIVPRPKQGNHTPRDATLTVIGRSCPVCERLFVGEKDTKTCGATCANRIQSKAKLVAERQCLPADPDRLSIGRARDATYGGSV